MKKIIHLIYRLDIGGLEKVMMECINHLPENFEHTVISLTTVTEYANTNLNRNVRIIQLNKKSGNDLSLFVKLFKLFREIKPDVLHTYNLPTLEYQLIGFLSRIKTRIHAEHGRDISDPKGINKKYNLLRKIVNPFIHHWIAVSKDLQDWLVEVVSLPREKVRLIYNGVDTDYFQPQKQLFEEKTWIIGTIGRCDPIKNQKILIDVYKNIISKTHLKIAIHIIGNGGEYENLKNRINNENLGDYFYLPGSQYNIKEILQTFKLFVLPSIAEGVPMTVLEAMSMGLPVICSNVGGIPEVVPEQAGILVDPENEQELSKAILSLINDKTLAEQMGENARQHVIKHFSIHAMVSQYHEIYREE